MTRNENEDSPSVRQGALGLYSSGAWTMSTSQPDALWDRERVETLIDAFVVDKRYVPAGTRPVRLRSELPLALEGHIHDDRPEEAWRAWTDGARIWFVVGSLEEAASRPGRPALRLAFFAPDGGLESTGVWMLNAAGRWDLHEV